MGDNKISEVTSLTSYLRERSDYAASFDNSARVVPIGVAQKAVVDAASIHLQGEAVPVARLPDYVRSAISGLAHIAMKDAPQVAMLHVGVIDNWLNSTHLQPAELSEVSGNSGELVSDIYKVASTPGMTPIDLADWIRDALLRNLYDLAATGKQQVGEVEGDGLASAARAGLPFIAYAFAQGVDGAEEAGRAIESALASRQPVGLSPIATRKLADLAAQGYITNGVAIFNPATGKRGLVDNLGYVGWQGAKVVEMGLLPRYTHVAWKDPFTDAIKSDMVLSPDGEWVRRGYVLALIDGRDAGTGVGNIQPPRDLRTKLGDVG